MLFKKKEKSMESSRAAINCLSQIFRNIYKQFKKINLVNLSMLERKSKKWLSN